MKSKLYYYEMLLDKRFNSADEIAEFLSDLKKSEFVILGYDLKQSPKSKAIEIRFQLVSLRDEPTYDRVNAFFIKTETHPINFRTRSITGDDLAIFRGIISMANMSEATLRSYCDKINVKEVKADDTKSN